jgi:hypothetical protein
MRVIELINIFLLFYITFSIQAIYFVLLENATFFFVFFKPLILLFSLHVKFPRLIFLLFKTVFVHTPIARDSFPKGDTLFMQLHNLSAKNFSPADFKSRLLFGMVWL